MIDVFASARYQGAVIHVSHHGKPWVPVVSPESARHIQTMRDLGRIEPDEIAAVVRSLGSAIGLEEVAVRIARNRADS